MLNPGKKTKLVALGLSLISLSVIAGCNVHSMQPELDPPKVKSSIEESSPSTNFILRQEASQLFFSNERVGWVVSNGALYRTTDSGKHWQFLYRTDPTHSVQVFFTTEQEGWMAINQWSGKHNHLLLRTSDGGKTWRRLLNLESPIFTVNFVDNRTGFVRDRWDYLRQTKDGGNKWTELGFPEGEQHLSLFEGLQYFFFVTEKQGWGYGSSIWRTQDGANTWSEVVDDKKINGMLSSACFVDDKHGWIVGSGREIWRMTDGNTWQRASNIPVAQGPVEAISKELPSSLYSVNFINTKEGWIAANDRTVLHSTDGGDTWEIISRWSCNIRALRFLSRTEGWAIDEDGQLLRTTDGGRSWSTQELP